MPTISELDALVRGILDSSQNWQPFDPRMMAYPENNAGAMLRAAYFLACGAREIGAIPLQNQAAVILAMVDSLTYTGPLDALSDQFSGSSSSAINPGKKDQIESIMGNAKKTLIDFHAVKSGNAITEVLASKPQGDDRPCWEKGIATCIIPSDPNTQSFLASLTTKFGLIGAGLYFSLFVALVIMLLVFLYVLIRTYIPNMLNAK